MASMQILWPNLNHYCPSTGFDQMHTLPDLNFLFVRSGCFLPLPFPFLVLPLRHLLLFTFSCYVNWQPVFCFLRRWENGMRIWPESLRLLNKNSKFWSSRLKNRDFAVFLVLASHKQQRRINNPSDPPEVIYDLRENRAHNEDLVAGTGLKKLVRLPFVLLVYDLVLPAGVFFHREGWFLTRIAHDVYNKEALTLTKLFRFFVLYIYTRCLAGFSTGKCNICAGLYFCHTAVHFSCCFQPNLVTQYGNCAFEIIHFHYFARWSDLWLPITNCHYAQIFGLSLIQTTSCNALMLMFSFDWL